MIKFAPCTEEAVALAKSMSDEDIEDLIDQIRRHERKMGEYWDIMFVRDLWALGIEPRMAPPGWKLVARFGIGPFNDIPRDWEDRKSGRHVPCLGTAAEIEEYKAALQNKKAESRPKKDIAESKSPAPRKRQTKR